MATVRTQSTMVEKVVTEEVKQYVLSLSEREADLIYMLINKVEANPECNEIFDALYSAGFRRDNSAFRLSLTGNTDERVTWVRAERKSD